MNHSLTLSPPISIIRPLTLKLRFNLKIVWILSIFLIITLLVFYIFQIKSVISEGYLLQNYQKKLNKLSQENEILEINLAQVNSLGNIEKEIQKLGFEKIDKVYYIQVLESQIVTK